MTGPQPFALSFQGSVLASSLASSLSQPFSSSPTFLPKPPHTVGTRYQRATDQHVPLGFIE